MNKELLERVIYSVIPRSKHLETLISNNRLSAPLKSAVENRVHSGTTILVFQYSEGILFAADRQMSGGYSGIISQEVLKIHQLSDFSAIGCAGSVGDIQFAVRILEEINQSFSSRFNFNLSVLGQVNYLSNLLRDFRFYVLPWGLEMDSIIGGYDQKNGFQIYAIWSDGGKRRSDYLITGSGTDGAAGVLRESKDLIRDKRLNQADAIDLAVKAISRAGEGDTFTSDIRVAIPTIATITDKGYQVIDPSIIERATQILIEKEKRRV